MVKQQLDGDCIFLIREFLSRDECAALIGRSESQAYETGTVAGTIIEDVRNNDRLIADDPALAETLFGRAQSFLPAALEDQVLVGFNERFRFYRYGPGQTFKPHRDGVYRRFEEGHESRLTFMIYLNEGMEGGATHFYAGMTEAFHRRPDHSVSPAAGTALVFAHRVWHEGAVVEAGVKYVLRTDAMYGAER